VGFLRPPILVVFLWGVDVGDVLLLGFVVFLWGVGADVGADVGDVLLLGFVVFLWGVGVGDVLLLGFVVFLLRREGAGVGTV
jgi:nitrogen fixation-related uncharacterized protein